MPLPVEFQLYGLTVNTMHTHTHTHTLPAHTVVVATLMSFLPTPHNLWCAAVAAAQQPSLQVLQQEFGNRPVWSAAALEERVGGSSGVPLDALLPLVAYRFRSGPWRKVCVCVRARARMAWVHVSLYA